MISRIKITILVVCLCFLGALTAQAAPKVQEISAKELAAKVAENKGKIVVVNVFASWCPPCRQEVPDLISVRKEYSAQELEIIGVSIDDDTEGKQHKESKALMAFLDEMQTNYPVYIGNNSFIADININAVPHMYIYDKKGNLYLNHRGFITKEELVAVLKKLSAN